AATLEERAMQLQELHRLRVRRMIEDADYVAERDRLTAERSRLLENSQSGTIADRFELFEYVVSFSKYAVEWFLDAEPDIKRLIIKTVGSNFSMTGKKLRGEAVKPFRTTPKMGEILQLC